MLAQAVQSEPLGFVFEGDIAKTKSAFQHIAETIKSRYQGQDEDQVVLRVAQVQAALQRLEWALERAL